MTAEDADAKWTGPPDPDTLMDAFALNGMSDETFVTLFLVDLAEKGPRFVYREANRVRLRALRERDKALWRGRILPALREWRIPLAEIEEFLAETPSATEVPTPEASETLMTANLEPPTVYVEGFLLHGMTILAGRKKRGKSTLALDLSLSLALGEPAFGHLAVQQSPVLYISLEDGRELLFARLRQMLPSFAGHPNLTFLYDFPRLDTPEALHWLRQYVAHGIRVIIIDVLGRVLPKPPRQARGPDEYQLLYDTLSPLQRFANDHRIALIFLDHVRKADADDVFDTVQGSGAKVGVADHVMIYQRKFKAKDAQIQLCSRPLGDETFYVTLGDRRLAWVGMGEEYELSFEKQKILQVLEEEKRPMSVYEIMEAASIPKSQYGRFRQVVLRMYDDDLLSRMKRGKYAIGTYAEHGDESAIPF
jgi:hypothetical protein